jgi:hypothetical protein
MSAEGGSRHLCLSIPPHQGECVSFACPAPAVRPFVLNIRLPVRLCGSPKLYKYTVCYYHDRCSEELREARRRPANQPGAPRPGSISLVQGQVLQGVAEPPCK